MSVLILGFSFYKISENNKEIRSLKENIVSIQRENMIIQENQTSKVDSKENIRTINYEVKYEQGKGLVKTKLSTEDQKLLDDSMAKLKAQSRGFTYDDPNTIVISDNHIYLEFFAPKDGGGVLAYTLDKNNKNIISTISFGQKYNININTFVSGSDSGLFRYKYNEGKATQILNSSLQSPQTYFGYEGPMGSSGFTVSTTTNTITLDVFDSKKCSMPQGDDTFYCQKISQRTFSVE